jgi:hypothetical protein
MEEIFKQIEGFEDYQISNLGRVKSFKKGREKILKSYIYKVKLMLSLIKQKTTNIN